MSLRTTFRRYSGEEDCPKGQWTRLNYGGDWYVVVGCPVCGRMNTLASNHRRTGKHSIEADGHVSPSVSCRGRCGFHEEITLAGWKA